MCIEIYYMRTEVLLKAVLAVSSAYSRLLHAGMEALNCLEVHAVDIRLAELQFTTHAGGGVDVLGEY